MPAAHLAAVPSPPPADDDIARHLAHLRVERRLSERTLQLYAAAFVRLKALAAAEMVALRGVKPHHVRRWVAQWRRGSLSPRSIALLLSAWRGFYRWLGREGSVASNPVDGVRAPKSGQPLPKSLPVDVAMRLADHADADATHAALEARDRCIVELLYGCGLRISELLGLDVVASRAARGWVDAAAGEAQVLGKGRKRRSVPVGKPALRALEAWLGQRDVLATPGERALIVGRLGRRLSAVQLRARLRQRALQAGVPSRVHPHMLRHSFASHLLQSSSDLRGVQELLGHAHIRTTQVYTQLDFQHLSKVYDATHPRAKQRGDGDAE